MKILKTTYLGSALLLAAALSSCQNDFDDPGLQVPEATWQANTTIAELKEHFWKGDTNYAIECPEREDGSHYIIKGRVISSDASGNIYKSMYIQDATGAITLSINQNSLYNQYRLGQEVVIDVTGLYIGKYAGLEQIGGYGEYNGTPQVSFMIYPNFTSHTQLNGTPVQDLELINYGQTPQNDGYYCTVMKISDLPTDEAGIRNMSSRLVELRNVHFEEGGENTYSTYQNTENRNLMDEQGNTIVVRTSGYSTFYANTLPKGNGTVRALLSYFNGTWQLLLRSTADCMFESKGQKEDPYTVEEALALQNTGTAGWVKGYIVGAVKGGVSTVTSNSDIIWGTDVDMDNNVVIGATADTRDFTKCMVVPLPAGSELRAKVNLIDNRGVYGQALSVRGTFAPQMGMASLTGNNGTADEFQLGGSTTPDNPDLGETVSLNVKDAKDFAGTFAEEIPQGDPQNANGQAAHWQPLQSMMLGDFAFTFSYPSGTKDNSTPAYYLSPSWNPNTAPTLRLYRSSEMTVKAPAGKKLGKIVFKASTKGTVEITANTGKVVIEGETDRIWTGNAESITFTFAGSYRINSFDFTLVK